MAWGGGLSRYCVSKRTDITTNGQRLPSSLQASRGIRAWLHIFDGALSALNVCAIGTATNIFCSFCDYVCRDIETNHIPGTDLHSILIWDNLAAHHSRYLHNTVANRVSPSNFSIIPWPPYHPKYGPIEYKICEVMEKI